MNMKFFTIIVLSLFFKPSFALEASKAYPYINLIDKDHPRTPQKGHIQLFDPKTPKQKFHIIAHDGKHGACVGEINCEFNFTNDSLYIAWLRIFQHHRRQGYAKSTLRFIIQECHLAPQKPSFISLLVINSNEPAYKLYKHIGFYDVENNAGSTTMIYTFTPKNAIMH